MNKKLSQTPDISKGIEIEFNALRAEVLKRIEIRQQVISVTLTFAGVFLSLGLTNSTVAFIYPLISVFLAAGWAENGLRIREIGNYIRNNLETTLPGLGWETYRNTINIQTRFGPSYFVNLASKGIFLLTQLMAIGVGLANFSFTIVEKVLLGIDIITFILTLILFEYVSRSNKRNESKKINPKRSRF